MKQIVQKALEAIAEGKFVLVYDADGREEETDFVIASTQVKEEHIMRMRKDGGGLICVTLHDKVCEKIGIPRMVSVLRKGAENFPLLTRLIPEHLPYDTKSAFSITVNSRTNYTGITDHDRSVTIQELGSIGSRVESDLIEGDVQEEFGKTFRAPGHVHLLRTSPEILKDRFGHTELATALMIMAGQPSSAAICEMMGDDGNALSKEAVAEYAQKNGFIFLEGKDIIEEWKVWSK